MVTPVEVAFLPEPVSRRRDQEDRVLVLAQEPGFKDLALFQGLNSLELVSHLTDRTS